MVIFSKSLVASGFISFAFAAPALLGTKSSPVGGLLGGVSNVVGGVVSDVVSPIASGIAEDLDEGTQILSAAIQALEDTLKAQVTSVPTDIPDALATLSSIFASTPTNLINDILELVPNGIPTDEVETLLTATISPENSSNNNNPIDPKQAIYPQKSPKDAPYSLSEDQLRQVIYIPKTFTYGQKPPVILIPGTGSTGYQAFAGNYIPLLKNASYADPVWLNIPDKLLGDAQIHAEYVAYAINYMAAITNCNVSVISWSQGGLVAQWSFKYWPSTRDVTTQLIANAPDYHGTVLAYALCPGFPTIPCPAAVIQQEYTSNFVSALRANGGDSAYVPTTNVYSSTDQIVQPQSPVTGASGYLLDECNLGVTNAQVQDVCGGKGPAGTVYTHEGVLYNPLGYALSVFALQNGRPAKLEEIDLDTVCGQIVSPGLDLTDVLITEEAILIAGASVALSPNRQFDEPTLMPYAQKSGFGPSCASR